jgi:hypothetical protein
MKIKFIVIFLLLVISLSSFTLIDGTKKHKVDLPELQSFLQKVKQTHREKNGKVKDEIWEGVDLIELLHEYQISNFDQLRFSSEDNYQVRLTKQEIEEYQPILALWKNDEKLSEDKIRLIVPQIRDMFWIQGIAEIATEKSNEMPLPHTLFTAESITKNMKLISDPDPFKDVQGLFFIKLVENVFPVLQGDFFLLSADGVSHKLDIDKYLKNAVLIFDDGKYNLQSPDMPGGMWIKNLAYIQLFDRVIFFKDQFFNWHDLAKLAGWKKIPTKLTDQNGNEINPKVDFSDPTWLNTGKIVWQK